jgi:hypothetical protein
MQLIALFCFGNHVNEMLIVKVSFIHGFISLYMMWRIENSVAKLPVMALFGLHMLKFNSYHNNVAANA